MPGLNEQFHRSEFYLIPGPWKSDEPMYTHAVSDFEEYAYEDIAGALLSLPEVHDRHPAVLKGNQVYLDMNGITDARTYFTPTSFSKTPSGGTFSRGYFNADIRV